MAEGRSRAWWGHTAQVLALIANVNRDPKKTSPFKASDFDPHARALEAGTAAPKVKITDLKGLFAGRAGMTRGADAGR